MNDGPAPMTDAVVSDQEIANFLEARPGASSPGALEPSVDARDVARRIGATWVELVADLASQAMLARPMRGAERLRTVVHDVARLSRELDDTELERLDADLPPLVEAALAASDPDAMHAAGQALRDWVLAYADVIGGDAGHRLRCKVIFRRGTHPLATYLRSIRGIGERRLDRLYHARLLTCEALAEAEPGELAAVARMPRALAEEVIDASRRFVSSQRVSTLRSFKVLAADVVTSVNELGGVRTGRERLLSALRQALDGIESLIQEIDRGKE